MRRDGVKGTGVGRAWPLTEEGHFLLRERGHIRSVDTEAGHSPSGGGKVNVETYDVFAFPCWVRQTSISCAGQVGGEGEHRKNCQRPEGHLSRKAGLKAGLKTPLREAS